MPKPRSTIPPLRTVYTLTEIADLVGGDLVGQRLEEPIRHWAFDSRLPFPNEGSCFLALEGPVRSGGDFVQQAHRRGAKLFCVSELEDRNRFDDSGYLVVDDVLASVQALATVHRERFEGTVVGITGSNGKTIVKEWLHTLLGGAQAGVYRSPGSFNSQLGVALSVLQIPASAKTAVIEAGISRSGEMNRLAQMLRPNLGILTNLGGAHDAGFSDREHKLREKLALFAGAEAVVFPADQEGLTASVSAACPRAKLLAWTAEGALDAPDGVGVRYGSGEFEFATHRLPLPYPDAASRQNLTNAALAASYLGADAALLAERVGRLGRPDLRLTLSPGRDGSLIVDDTYNADLEGFDAAIDFFTQHCPPDAPTLLVLGPILETGLEIHELQHAVSERIGRAGFERVWTVGNELSGLDSYLGPDVTLRHYDEGAQLLRAIDLADVGGTAVLVKGPRRYALDRVSMRLRDRSHDVRLEIDLSTLADNLAQFRRRLKPETKICVMAKASAYGSGSRELARWLADRGVDYLAVAYLDEAVELRGVGCSLPIIVANATQEHYQLLRTHELEPEITTIEQLRTLGPARGEAEPPLPIHLKLDTGMHRLGFDVTAPDAPAFTELLGELGTGAYRVISVFSHLSAADRSDPEAEAFTDRQAERFRAAALRVETAVGYRLQWHIANSAGAWRRAGLQFDMVRLGIGLYGLGLEAAELQPVHRLVAQLVQIREVAAGEVVGYDLGGRADRARRIGIVNIGYADGLRRQAGNGAYRLGVRGRLLPTVGNICMDFCMVDLSDAPLASLGDEVEVFGALQPAGALAACYGTIPYEVFTGVGQRVRRVYYR